MIVDGVEELKKYGMDLWEQHKVNGCEYRIEAYVWRIDTFVR